MKITFFSLMIIFLFNITNSLFVHASTAAFSVSQIAADSMQISIIGGDSNIGAFLHYISDSTIKILDLGMTDNQGNLSKIINSGTYHILGGVSSYIVINGHSSNYVMWPNYSNSGDFSLSPAGLSIVAGQTSTVIASVGSNIRLVDNPNPSVATVSINNSQITVTAVNNGATNITLCATSIGCRTLYVSVGNQNDASQSNNVSQTPTVVQMQSTIPTISFSQNALNLNVGQSQGIAITNTGTLGLSNNSNMRVALASLSGSTLAIKALSAGSASIGVCSVDDTGYTMACGNLVITVIQPQNQIASSTNQKVLFSNNNVNLKIGEQQTILVDGSGGYYISQNSGTGSVSAVINGNVLYLNGISFGGSNITVCQRSGQCNNIYVYVSTEIYKNTTTNLSPNLSNINNTALPNSSYVFNKQLYVNMTKVGVSDLDVTALQKRLTADALYSGPITGYFGSLTKKAVQAFQTKYKLNPVGVVGPGTRAILNEGK